MEVPAFAQQEQPAGEVLVVRAEAWNGAMGAGRCAGRKWLLMRSRRSHKGAGERRRQQRRRLSKQQASRQLQWQIMRRLRNTYRWNHAICASQDGAGPPVWLEAGTADRERKRRRRRAPVNFAGEGIGTPETAANTCTVLSEGSGAVDKLGMSVCCVRQVFQRCVGRLVHKRPAA
jgi:hypothetical protein